MAVAVIVNGKPRTGKDTFADICVEILREYDVPASKASSVDQVKVAAKTLGWDGIKDETGRKFLSDLKDLSTAVYEGPMKYMLSVLDKQKDGFVFFMVREPEEIAKFVKTAPTTKTVKVFRETEEPEFGNHADQRVNEYDYDTIVMNVGTLDHLKHTSRAYVGTLLKSYADAHNIDKF